MNGEVDNNTTVGSDVFRPKFGQVAKVHCTAVTTYDCMTQSVKQHVGERSHWALAARCKARNPVGLRPGLSGTRGRRSQANREITLVGREGAGGDLLTAGLPTGMSSQRSSKDDDAVKRVSLFLSESRVLAEKTQRCKHTGCAYLVTGLAPKYCCRMCARSPGAHGPKCAKKLLTCSTPGCGFAVTGLSERHCCRMCAGGKDHGPNCWCLPVELASSSVDEVDEPEDLTDGGAMSALDLEPCPPCQPCKPPMAEAPSAVPPDDASGPLAWVDPGEPAGSDDEEPIDVSDEQVAELQGKVDDNMSSIATNAAIIQALREALNGRGG